MNLQMLLATGTFVVQMDDFGTHTTMGAERIVQISLFRAIQMMMK